MTNEPTYLKLPDGHKIAYHKTSAKDSEKPCIIFVHGFRSDMEGTKALALEYTCNQEGFAYVRFDCSGHGKSSGTFTDGTIGQWKNDLLAVIDEVSEGPLVLVGSSMGAWLMILAALERKNRVAGLIGIASAPDFIEELIWKKLTTKEKHILQKDGIYDLANSSVKEGVKLEPCLITQPMVEEAKNHLVLRGNIDLHCPVRLIHGQKDIDVPYGYALLLAEKIVSKNVDIILSKSGEHRMSKPEDIQLLTQTLTALVKSLFCKDYMVFPTS